MPNSSDKSEKNYHKCTYSGLNFQGKCPIEKCWANIGDLNPSGCLHIRLGKEEIHEELPNFFGLDSEELEKLIDRGRQIVKLSLNIQETYEKIISSSTSNLCCPKCGQPGKALECLRVELCKQRSNLYNEYHNHSLFKALGSKLTRYIFQRLLSSEIGQSLLTFLENDEPTAKLIPQEKYRESRR
jgi:hypothetical protein